MVGLLTFYQGESCHYFLLVCAFSPALTCAFAVPLYTDKTFQVMEKPSAWEAGPSGGQRLVPRPGRAPTADLWRYFVRFLVPLRTYLGVTFAKKKKRLPSTISTFILVVEGWDAIPTPSKCL